MGAIGLALAVLLTSCGGGQPTPEPDGRISVVTTTTIFADLIANVGGDLVRVTSLVPKNGDVHTFAPRPSDIKAVADARLLVRRAHLGGLCSVRRHHCCDSTPVETRSQ
jgi:zinc/manganese transport system substrate-binding protein